MALCLGIQFVVLGVWMAVQCSNAFVLENRVVPLSNGGQDADLNGIARSVVQIIRNRETICSGSIFDSLTVVTAKHCFQDGNENFLSTLDFKFEVVYGSVQLYDPDNEENFCRISIQDEDFHHHPSKDVDVTVLSLATEMIGAVRMELDKESSTQCDMPVQLYGFGDLDGDGNEPNVMQVLDTVVKTGCGEDWKDDFDDIITQVDGKTSCGGDSGGPLINVQTGQMISIHLAGGIKNRTCRPSDRNYSLKLSNVMDFIHAYCKQCD